MQILLRYVDWISAGLAILAALISMFLLELIKINNVRSKYPPGPRPLPFIGNMHQVIKGPLQKIKEMLKYGDLCTIFQGKRPAVVLNTLQILKEAFIQNGAMSSGRPKVSLAQWIMKGSGIIQANGYEWKQQRRFALHTLRDFGLGKKTVEERVMEESRFLIKEMLKHEGKPFYPIHPFMNAVSNIISSIIFGNRFEYNDEHFAKLLKILNENVRLSVSPLGQIVALFPILRYFPGPHQKMLQNSLAMQKFIHEIVDEHRKTLDPENLRDFIDAYMVEMSKQESSEGSSFHDLNMQKSISDLFNAGTETTANTLRWSLLYMMEHPKVQERCHKEIVSVLGFDRIPTMDDRVRLPYTYATVHEVQRCANIAPLGVLHEATAPIELQGHTMPKGTLFLSNLTAIMSDKKHWKYPNTFNPENFLDEKGQFCKQESFLVFSLGPRVCPGESLARIQLFIFFTCLMQHLHFSWPPGAPPHNMQGIMGVIRSPCPFNTICRRRANS